MSRQIRHTTMKDFDAIQKIYAYAREFMRRTGNPTQWGSDRPLPEAIVSDIENGNAYVVVEDGQIVGAFTFWVGHDITYDVIEDGAWPNDEEYGVIHKVASAENVHGIMLDILEYTSRQTNNLRIDTHHDNKVMQHVVEKNGFSYCGIIYTDDGTKRLAYQKVLR